MEDNMGNYFEPESEIQNPVEWIVVDLPAWDLKLFARAKIILYFSKYMLKSYKRDYLFTIKQTSTTLPMTLPNQDEAHHFCEGVFL
jgi:hypothetical protein